MTAGTKARLHLLIYKFYTNIIMKLLTEHFDITNYGCILDLFTDKHIFYYEFDNNHKITFKMVFKRPNIIWKSIQ